MRGDEHETAEREAAEREAAERRSERMDTAYSPRLHEEEPSDATSQLNLESWQIQLPGDADFAAFVERAV